MNDPIDRAVLYVAYHFIEASAEKRVAGSTVWEKTRLAIPDLAPVTVPARLRRLVSQGLLEKDLANSNSRNRVYAPTEAGYRQWQILKTANG